MERALPPFHQLNNTSTIFIILIIWQKCVRQLKQVCVVEMLKKYCQYWLKTGESNSICSLHTNDLKLHVVSDGTTASMIHAVLGLAVEEVNDKKDRDTVARVIKTAVMSKQYGLEDFLAGLIADACS